MSFDEDTAFWSSHLTHVYSLGWNGIPLVLVPVLATCAQAEACGFRAKSVVDRLTDAKGACDDEVSVAAVMSVLVELLVAV